MIPSQLSKTLDDYTLLPAPTRQTITRSQREPDDAPLKNPVISTLYTRKTLAGGACGLL